MAGLFSSTGWLPVRSWPKSARSARSNQIAGSSLDGPTRATKYTRRSAWSNTMHRSESTNAASGVADLRDVGKPTSLRNSYPKNPAKPVWKSNGRVGSSCTGRPNRLRISASKDPICSVLVPARVRTVRRRFSDRYSKAAPSGPEASPMKLNLEWPGITAELSSQNACSESA